MKLQCTSTSSNAVLVLPFTMAFILVCSQSQGWLWPIIGYAALLISMQKQPPLQCRRWLFWSIATAGLVFLLVALTLKGRWHIIL